MPITRWRSAHAFTPPYGDVGSTRSYFLMGLGALAGGFLASKLKPRNSTFLAIGAIVGGIMGTKVGA